MAAAAAIAAVGSDELDEILSKEADGAGAAVTASQIDLALIEELHGSNLRTKEKGERRRRSPFLFRLFGPGAGVLL
jgi:DNA-binding SARP family transcriptional activator